MYAICIYTLHHYIKGLVYKFHRVLFYTMHRSPVWVQACKVCCVTLQNALKIILYHQNTSKPLSEETEAVYSSYLKCDDKCNPGRNKKCPFWLEGQQKTFVLLSLMIQWLNNFLLGFFLWRYFTIVIYCEDGVMLNASWINLNRCSDRLWQQITL
jgi:hypothetical protein